MPGWWGRPGLGGAWSRGPALAQRRNWRETVSGLPKRGREGGPGRGRAAGQGVGGEPEDGVEALARGSRMGRPAGRRSRKGGASGCWAASMAASRRVSHLGFGGAEEEGGEDGPLGVGERFPVPFGGVAAVVAEADHGGGRPSGETQEHNMNERLRQRNAAADRGARRATGAPRRANELQRVCGVPRSLPPFQAPEPFAWFDAVPWPALAVFTAFLSTICSAVAQVATSGSGCTTPPTPARVPAGAGHLCG